MNKRASVDLTDMFLLQPDPIAYLFLGRDACRNKKKGWVLHTFKAPSQSDSLSMG